MIPAIVCLMPSSFSTPAPLCPLLRTAATAASAAAAEAKATAARRLGLLGRHRLAARQHRCATAVGVVPLIVLAARLVLIGPCRCAMTGVKGALCLRENATACAWMQRGRGFVDAVAMMRRSRCAALMIMRRGDRLCALLSTTVIVGGDRRCGGQLEVENVRFVGS